MAVTATFIRATDYRVFYAISHDGAAGDTVTITNAQLQAAAAGHPNVLAMLQTPVSSDYEAVVLLVGGARGVARVTPGKLAFWSLDAKNNGGLAEVEVTGQAGTINDGILELQVLHTINR
jgi:hypothetical protein